MPKAVCRYLGNAPPQELHRIADTCHDLQNSMRNMRRILSSFRGRPIQASELKQLKEDTDTMYEAVNRHAANAKKRVHGGLVDPMVSDFYTDAGKD